MYAFPTTAKALSTFPDAGSLALVDFKESGVRRLGVPVTSKEQGEALLAHVHATMKDEAPKLLCYAPTGARKIPLRAAGK
jgi:hypothetical protein